MAFFDLASLAKPLVTAPMALTCLDLDEDRRGQLGFTERRDPLTVRQLLSHSSGLPPWLPFTGERLSDQLRRGFPSGKHALLRTSQTGVSAYSDLGFRLLGELLEQESNRPFAELGNESSGLSAAPWDQAPVEVPDGPDADAWRIAEPNLPVPPRSPFLPHDANARAGMRGHAGFGATPEQMKLALEQWIAKGFPERMAIDTARSEDSTRWGLGLQRSLKGRGRFGQLLASSSSGVQGIHLLVSESMEAPCPVESEDLPGEPTEWWMHFGYTGPALFVRPRDGACICILAHRRGPNGELLDPKAIHARRWALLSEFLRQT